MSDDYEEKKDKDKELKKNKEKHRDKEKPEVPTILVSYEIGSQTFMEKVIDRMKERYPILSRTKK